MVKMKAGIPCQGLSDGGYWTVDGGRVTVVDVMISNCILGKFR